MLLRLAALTGENRYRDAAERALAPIVGIAAQHPTGFAQWLMAYQLASSPIDEIAIVGDPAADDTQALLAAARAGFRPDRVIALSPDPASSAVPLLRDRAGHRRRRHGLSLPRLRLPAAHHRARASWPRQLEAARAS